MTQPCNYKSIFLFFQLLVQVILIVYLMDLAPVVQKVDNAIHRINHYPLEYIAIGFTITYPVDSDLSGG